MSQHEPYCQLCSVVFNIARLRRVDEPEEASWDPCGRDFVEADDSFPRFAGFTGPGVNLRALCEEGSGCTISDLGGNRPGEHLAGPGCVSYNGYSGHRISVAEMKGCRAVQCLIKKNASWMPEDDDQDFELDGDYFLSAIRHDLPENTTLDGMIPIRHGVERFCIGHLESDTEDAVPFHPTCFEIYKAVCLMRIGRVDTKALFCSRFIQLNSRNWTFPFETINDPAIVRHTWWWWMHEPGCEYLVANPIEVPDLPDILERLVDSNCKKMTFGDAKEGDDSQTQGHRMSPTTSKSIQDPFSRLPAEVNSMVLDHLGSKDIAKLRLATPVFRQLPTILFRKLLLKEMPWLFEVKDLDVARINWHDCYCALKSACRDLKGLQNRRRIWRDIEELITRVDVYRSESMVGAH